MKKKFIIPMAIVMTTALSIPMYVFADNSTSNSSTTTNATSTSQAQGSNTNSATSSNTAAPSSLSISLDDALNMVEKGNTQIILDDKDIEILNKQYQEAIAYQQKEQETASDTMTEDDALTLKYNVPVALYNLNNEKHQRDTDLKNTKVTVTNEYESILAAQMNVNYINEEIANLQKDMDSINAKIGVGLAKASDIEPDKATMATYQASLSSAQSGIQSSMITLKNDLGIDLDTQLTLTSTPIDYVKYDDTNIDGKIQDSIKNSYSIQSLNQQIQNTQLQYDIFKNYGDGQMNSEEITIETEQSQLQQMPNNIEVQLETAYNSLKSLENTVEADKLNIEAAQINVNTVQANYNLGQATYLDVSNAQLKLSQAQNTLQQDIISYMTASENFQNSLQDQ